jgi:CRP/FNR family transcriptional regulator, cyclic AMP receptor protein
MSLVTELQQNRLFKGVDAEHLEELEQFMTHEIYKTGDVLVRQGDIGLAMYIIVSGRVRIFIQDDKGNDVTFRSYGPREVFGEFAILDQQPRSASAAAQEPLDVLVLNRDNFLKFLKERPVVGLAMMRSLAERIRYTTTYLEKIIDWTESLSKGNYEQAIREMALSSTDDEIQQMIRTFLDMIHSIRAREEQLKAGKGVRTDEMQSPTSSTVGDDPKR